MIVDVQASSEEHTGNTYGIRADDTVSLKKAMVISSEKIDIDVVDNVANAYGVRANCNNLENGSGTYYNVYGEIELGGANSVITVDATANKGFAVGIAAHRANDKNQGNASSVTVNGKSLVINANGAYAYGVLAMNNTDGNATKVSTVTINSADTTINAKNGLVAMSQGKIAVQGNLTVNAEDGNAIVARGKATVDVNTSKSKDVVLTGDIVFDYDGYTSGTGIDANVNLNLTNEKSSFTGRIYKDTEAPDDLNNVTGMNISLSNGATWNLTGASIVTNATFGADSVLNIDGTKYIEEDYALNASEGTASLTVEQGAILAIEGIEEKVTYNIAKGFGVEASEGENWTIDNNLMTGEWAVVDDGLQVTTVNKDAEDIVADMNVSSSTAQSLANVTAAAQSANVEGKADGTGDEKAVALVNAIANAPSEVAGQVFESVSKMAEAGGNSATAASIVKNVTGVTNDRLSFNCGHSAPHKGGHGVGLFEEGSGADVWVEYVHGKDEVEDMPSTAGKTSYEGKYNGIVMGVDFKKVNKFQSGIAFNYGEGDTNSVGSAARTHSDYDFWGIGYYGSIHNDDSNVIFDIGYAKTDSDVENTNELGVNFKASPETTTWTAGVKLEKLYQNENVQIVPYSGLRFMSIDPDDYSTECASASYKMERQNVWLLPLGVSIKQEVTNDNGWTVSPRVDLSYIWAFGDTDSEMEFSTLGTKTNIGYEVMDDGSFLGLVGIEAHKGQWGFGVSYSYQKGDHSESKKWFIDANYSF